MQNNRITPNKPQITFGKAPFGEILAPQSLCDSILYKSQGLFANAEICPDLKQVASGRTILSPSQHNNKTRAAR
jgi:hypothetical protein